MATTSISVSCPSNDWTVVADGATYSSTSIQPAGGMAQFAIAASKPALTSDAWFMLNPGAGLQSLVTIPLGTGNILYGRGVAGAVQVRGFVVA